MSGALLRTPAPGEPDTSPANLERVKVGMWYTMCCFHDLAQIEDAADLERVREELRDWDSTGVTVWATERDALLDLRLSAHESDHAGIDERLARSTP